MCFFFQAEDGIRDAQESRGLGDVYKRQPQEVASRIESFLQRKKNQPRGFNSGSMFKNPPGSAAGYLIEQAGLKGFRIGGAKISEIHANFIINDGSATTADIRALLDTVKVRVRERFGIDLQEEVKILDERL